MLQSSYVICYIWMSFSNAYMSNGSLEYYFSSSNLTDRSSFFTRHISILVLLGYHRSIIYYQYSLSILSISLLNNIYFFLLFALITIPIEKYLHTIVFSYLIIFYASASIELTIWIPRPEIHAEKKFSASMRMKHSIAITAFLNNENMSNFLRWRYIHC